MRKILNIMVCSLLSLFIITGFSYSKSNISYQVIASNIETIAKNAALQLGNWENVSITSNKNLYNFNGRLIAHCLDLKNNKTGGSGYVIISEDPEITPILEFSPNSISPYTRFQSTTDEQYIYTGAMEYYSEKNVKLDGKSIKKYYDIKSKVELQDADVKVLIETDKNKDYKSINSDKNIRQRAELSSKNFTSSNTDIKPMGFNIYKNLSGVPNYDSYRGCGPVAAAMILEYRWYYQTPSPTTLIDEIANRAGTASNGYTGPGNLCDAIVSVMSDYGVSGVSSYSIGMDFYTYTPEIDNGLPAIIMMWGSQKYFPGTSIQMGYHYVTGTGYQWNDYGQYVICNDGWGDSGVYINVNSSEIGWHWETLVVH